MKLTLSCVYDIVTVCIVGDGVCEAHDILGGEIACVTRRYGAADEEG